jgi:hypothetical protein
MHSCKYCYLLQEDFNKIADDMVEWFGLDQVAIIKVDGQIVTAIATKYSIQSYPSFIHIAPNTDGKLES